MMKYDDLGNRMKEYESVPKTRLTRRMPVIIRLDGKAFHSFTNGFNKPFDKLLMETMQSTMKYLCENVQGCVLGYTQSDEISLLLVDYQRLNSAAWFDNKVQKICSISASMTTMAFNRKFAESIRGCYCEIDNDDLIEEYIASADKGAMFDARCFNLPKEEVTNYFFWRQQDATRNSIQMVGQAYFSHKQLQNKSCNEIQEMLFHNHGINWNDLPTTQKRGSCCIKERYKIVIVDSHSECESVSAERTRWVIDDDIPQFRGEGRDYIERLVWVGE
jgi:tRNA(His) 5'-end guanylyltransferase